LAEEIRTQLGVDSETIPGSGGIFDIEFEGKLVFSKTEKGRFPEESEITDLLKKIL
jgi:selenoprotein W-related protein